MTNIYMAILTQTITNAAITTHKAANTLAYAFPCTAHTIHAHTHMATYPHPHPTPTHMVNLRGNGLGGTVVYGADVVILGDSPRCLATLCMCTYSLPGNYVG